MMGVVLIGGDFCFVDYQIRSCVDFTTHEYLPG